MSALVITLSILGVATAAFLMFRLAEAIFQRDRVRGDQPRTSAHMALPVWNWTGEDLKDIPSAHVLMDHLDVVLADHGLRAESILCFVEIDDLDDLDHAHRDDVILETVRRLRDASRGDDLIARIGEHQFVIVASGVLDNDGALALAARIGQAASAPIDVEGSIISAPASVGVTFLLDSDEPRRAIARGEENLRLARGDFAS